MRAEVEVLYKYSGKVFVTERNENAVKKILDHESHGREREAEKVFLDAAFKYASAVVWIEYGNSLKEEGKFLMSAISFMIAAGVSINKNQNRIKENYLLASRSFFLAGDLHRSLACERKANQFTR